MKKGKTLKRVAAMYGIGLNIPATAQAAMSVRTPQIKKVHLNVNACGCGDCNEVPSGTRGSGD